MVLGLNVEAVDGNDAEVESRSQERVSEQPKDGIMTKMKGSNLGHGEWEMGYRK